MVSNKCLHFTICACLALGYWGYSQADRLGSFREPETVFPLYIYIYISYIYIYLLYVYTCVCVYVCIYIYIYIYIFIMLLLSFTFVLFLRHGTWYWRDVMPVYTSRKRAVSLFLRCSKTKLWRHYGQALKQQETHNKS